MAHSHDTTKKRTFSHFTPYDHGRLALFVTNGSEFSERTQAFDSDDVMVSYTHPYTSSERGTNERYNGLIRRFIPKRKTIEAIADTRIGYVENWCNTLPRKILGYQTPNDQFAGDIAKIAYPETRDGRTLRRLDLGPCEHDFLRLGDGGKVHRMVNQPIMPAATPYKAYKRL